MNTRESANVAPGCVAWIALVSLFLFTGVWIDSIAKARQHPLVLTIIAATWLATAIYHATGTDARMWTSMPLGLIASGLVSLMLVALMFGLAHIRITEFVVFGRTYSVGFAVVTLLPLMFVAMMIASIVVGIAYVIRDSTRKRGV